MAGFKSDGVPPLPPTHTHAPYYCIDLADL